MRLCRELGRVLNGTHFTDVYADTLICPRSWFFASQIIFFHLRQWARIGWLLWSSYTAQFWPAVFVPTQLLNKLISTAQPSWTEWFSHWFDIEVDSNPLQFSKSERIIKIGNTCDLLFKKISSRDQLIHQTRSAGTREWNWRKRLYSYAKTK